VCVLQLELHFPAVIVLSKEMEERSGLESCTGRGYKKCEESEGVESRGKQKERGEKERRLEEREAEESWLSLHSN
jgi:hypothetical protein